MAGQQRIVAPFAGHVIGEGISENTLERIGTGVRAAVEGEDALADGQTAEFKFRMVTSQQSLEEELNIGVGIDARYGLFSGGARFDFAKSSSLDTKSTYILASATVKNALRSGRDFSQTEAAQQLIDAGDVEGFRRAFGTRFVQALRTGGELYVLVRVTSSNVKHQSSVAASLHAEYNGLVVAGSFKAAFNTARSDASSHTEVSITSMQVGGQGAQLQFVGAEADKIKAQMNAFAAAVHDHAVAYEAELLSYDALALPFPSPAELEDKREVLEDCLRLKQRYWSILADLRLAQGPDSGLFFSALPPAEELIALTARFTTLLNDLMSHARKVADGMIPPALFVPVDEPALPLLKRRSSTNFGQWWTRRNDPTLLGDESLIIPRVGDEVAQHLTVSILDATPEIMERGSTFVEKLDLSQGDLSTIKRLPAILDSPLRRLSINLNQVASLSGVEQYPGLESLGCHGNRVEDLGPVASLGGLTSLFVIDNEITDLAPIAGLTRLEDLHLGGNHVETSTSCATSRACATWRWPTVTPSSSPTGSASARSGSSTTRSTTRAPSTSAPAAQCPDRRRPAPGDGGDLPGPHAAHRRDRTTRSSNRFDLTPAAGGPRPADPRDADAHPRGGPRRGDDLRYLPCSRPRPSRSPTPRTATPRCRWPRPRRDSMPSRSSALPSPCSSGSSRP